MSKQPSKNRASEEAYYLEWKRIDKVFKSMGVKDPYLGLFKPISLYKLLRKIDRELGKIHSFHKKIDSTMAACWSKSRSIPENVTIKEEYVKCKKPNCRRKQHGRYDAYWKDSKTKRN